MNDWKYFFEELNNPEQDNCCIFASDSQATPFATTEGISATQWLEILHWFRRDDISPQQKEALIRKLVNFDDNCGGFYQYRAYFLAAEALSYFPECSLGDAIVEQLLKWSYVYFGWQIFPQPLVKAARNTIDCSFVITKQVKLLYLLG